MNIPQFGFSQKACGISPDDVAAAERVFRAVEHLVHGNVTDEDPPPPTEKDLVKLAKRVKSMRLLRAQFFEERHFGEAAWDMLLALFIAQGEGYCLKISDVCNESGVPPTTALRWIDRLLETELAVKRTNPTDSRSTFVEIHPEARRKMREYLSQGWSRLVVAR